MPRYQLDKDSNRDWHTATETEQIIALIAASFNGVDSCEYFKRYFANPQHYQRRVRLFYQAEQLLGYCLLTFRRTANNSIVMGASAAFTPGYRGNNSTFGFSFLAAVSTWLGLNCLKTVGRATNYSKEDIARLKASNKAEIAFYCQLNPNFDNGTALMVLIPVNLKQLLYTGVKWLKALVKR